MATMFTKNRYVHYRTTIDGHSQERSCAEYPYSYTRFCIYKTKEWKLTDAILYSDRLYECYPDKYDKLKNKYLGMSDHYPSYQPEQIEKFLTHLLGCKIHITGMEEECNCSNGYPYWIIYFTKI